MRIGYVYINLTRDGDRGRDFRNTFIQRCPAIDARRILEDSAHPGRTLLEKSVGVTSRYNIDRNRRSNDREINSIGAVGCALSHISLWRMLANDRCEEEYRQLVDDAAAEEIDALYRYIHELDVLVIFEDDVHITEHLEHLQLQIASLCEAPNLSWDVFLLGCAPLVKNFTETSAWVHPLTCPPDLICQESFFGMFAYVITRPGARRLLELGPLPVELHIDRWMSIQSQFGNILVVRSPSDKIKINHKLGVSSIQHTMTDEGCLIVCVVVLIGICLVLFIIVVKLSSQKTVLASSSILVDRQLLP
jgi:GR25 family glycosyltransferase involved in LPS biosynthesis